MLALLAVTVIGFLAIVLVIGMLEDAGGFVGGSSMVPGMLVLMAVVIIVILVLGGINGSYTIQFN